MYAHREIAFESFMFLCRNVDSVHDSVLGAKFCKQRENRLKVSLGRRRIANQNNHLVRVGSPIHLLDCSSKSIVGVFLPFAAAYGFYAIQKGLELGRRKCQRLQIDSFATSSENDD